jgi:hypothetical protein
MGSAITELMSKNNPTHFPLFEGGPFAKLQAPLRLTGEEQRHVWRRMIFAVMATWVPLAVLAAVQGRAIGLNWRESMLLDVAMYARFLVALPLLILATLGCQRKLQAVVHHFLDAELVKETERESFFANITAMLRWRDSVVAAVVMVALAVVDAVAFGTVSVAQVPDSWRVVGPAGHRSLSLAGWWLVAVCEPLYEITMMQFFYRVALWWRFLWKTSRLELHLNAAHPDGAGGLAFLGMVLPTFQLPLFAIASSGAGTLANLMLLMGVSFVSFQYAIAASAVVLVVLMAGPLVFFKGQLGNVKQRAVLGCGALAGRQLRAFEEKWLGPSPPAVGEMLRAPDFSAVGNFNPTVTAIQKMNTLPFWPKQLVPLVVSALFPYLPVAAIEMPLQEILSQLWKLLM